MHRAASVGEHRKYVDQLLGHSVQGADDGTVGFNVVGRDRRYVVVLNLVAGAPQAPEGRNASRGGGLVNWALMASWIA